MDDHSSPGRLTKPPRCEYTKKYRATPRRQARIAQHKILMDSALKVQDKNTKRLYKNWAEGLLKDLNK